MKPKTILTPFSLLFLLFTVWGCRTVPDPTEAATQPAEIELLTTEEPEDASAEESVVEPEAEPTTQGAVEGEEVPAEDLESDVEEIGGETEEPIEEEKDTAASAESDDACIDCHTDNQALIDTSDPVEEIESENEGAG